MRKTSLLSSLLDLILWPVVLCFGAACGVGFATGVYLAIKIALGIGLGESGSDDINTSVIVRLWTLFPVVGGLIGLVVALRRLQRRMSKFHRK